MQIGFLTSLSLPSYKPEQVTFHDELGLKLVTADTDEQNVQFSS